MFKFQAQITGISPFLMHADNLEAMAAIAAMRDTISNDSTLKKDFKGGDDRCPAATWRAYLYNDLKHVTLPADNMMSCLAVAGKEFKRGKASNYSKVVPVAIAPETEHFAFTGNGRTIKMSDIEADTKKLGLLDFGGHVAAAEKLGIRLWAKRAGVNGKKHVRVRPRFESWTITANFIVVTDDFDQALLKQLFEKAGTYVGLGDWRPKSPKVAGPYGRFTTKLVF